MIKKMVVFFLSIIMCLSIPVHAVVTPKIQACRELIALERDMTKIAAARDQYDRDSATDVLAAHLNTGDVQAHVSRDNINGIAHGIGGFLETLYNPGQVVPERTLMHYHRIVSEKIKTLVDNLSGISRDTQRHVPQQLSPHEMKRRAQEASAVSAHAPATSNQQPLADQEQDLEEQGDYDVISWIQDNPRAVAIGALALYGLAAKYFGWPPFNARNEVAAVNAPQAGQAQGVLNTVQNFLQSLFNQNSNGQSAAPAAAQGTSATAQAASGASVWAGVNDGAGRSSVPRSPVPSVAQSTAENQPSVLVVPVSAGASTLSASREVRIDMPSASVASRDNDSPSLGWRSWIPAFLRGRAAPEVAMGRVTEV